MANEFVITMFDGKEPQIQYQGFHRDGDDWKLMQFTGLKDKNGKEIYEGDAFNCIYHRDGHQDHWYYVIFDNIHGAFDLQRVGPPCPQRQVHQGLIDVARSTNIGNIYDNPELIIK